MGTAFYPISQVAGAYKIPKADGSGKIDIGYIPDLSGTYQPLDGDLTALAALSSTGFAKRTGAATWSVGALSAGDIPDLSGTYQLLDADLTALAALTSTGFAKRTAVDTWSVGALASGDIPDLSATYALASHNHAASAITAGALALARGGTNADLSATGAATHFLRQESAGAAVTVGAILSADLTTPLTTPPAIGGTTPAAGSFTTLSAVATAAVTLRGLTLSQNSADIAAAIATFRKSRGTPASPSAVGSTDYVAVFSMAPYFNSAYRQSAGFGARINGAVGTTAPTDLFFWATNVDTTDPIATGHNRLNISGTTGYVSVGALTAPATRLHVLDLVAATAVVTNTLTVGSNSTGTPATGFGGAISLTLESSTTNDQSAALIEWLWNDVTHASRKADLVVSAYDTAKREGLRVRGNGSAAALGFFGTTPAARATGYTAFANLSTDRTLDANSTTLDEVADVLGTLIEDLKLLGLIAA